MIVTYIEMILQPRHFIRFIDGRAGDRTDIAFLPGAPGSHIHMLQTAVSLRRDYALKLLAHDVKFEGFSYIQDTIDHGMCLLENDYHLRFMYVRDNVRPEIYFLLLKTDKSRQELWLVTFHRLRKKQFTKRLDPGQIIRAHMELEFMG